MEIFYPEFAVVLPVFNESHVISDLLTELATVQIRIVCVDDGSSDSTARVIGNHKEVELVQHLINRGQGAALETGFEYLRRNPLNTRYVITFDADGQHDAKDIYTFVLAARSENYDLIFGNRFEGKQSNVPTVKRFLLRISALSVRVLLKLDLHDRHNGFRCISMAAISNFRLKCDSYEHADEILHIAKKMHLRICEVPVSIRYSDYSKSKGQPLINVGNMILKKVWG